MEDWWSQTPWGAEFHFKICNLFGVEMINGEMKEQRCITCIMFTQSNIIMPVHCFILKTVLERIEKLSYIYALKTDWSSSVPGGTKKNAGNFICAIC